MKLTDRYDADCVEAAQELAAKLARTTSANSVALICAALKEYACEHDKRITESQWAQKYREACEMIGRLHPALEAVVNSGPLNNGMRDDSTMALARAALEA